MDLLEASGHAKRLSQMFKAIEVIGQTMEEVGSLEQYEKEIKSRTVSAEKREKLALEKAVAAENAVHSAETKALQIVESGTAESGALIESAKKSAESILSEAKQAKDKVASQVRDLEAKVQAKQKELAQATDDLATMQKKIADTKTQIQQLLRA